MTLIGKQIAVMLMAAIFATLTGIFLSDDPTPAQAQTNTPATGTPLIEGAAQLDEELTVCTWRCIDDADGMTNVRFSYQWIRRDGTTDTDINGETSSSYTIVAADVGKTLKVRVSFDDDEGNPETLTSAATATVSGRRNSNPTGLPTISGTPQVGQKLTVNTSGISDADGLINVKYGGTWSAGEGYLRALIAPGKDLSYTVSRRDAGMTLDITVNFEDDAGKTHFLTSAKTVVVAATSPAAPENFEASATDPGDLDLSWEAPTWDLSGEISGDPTWGDGGSDITGYVVQWKEESDSWDRAADVSEATVTGTSYTIEGLTGGTEYTTRVIAVNDVGRGAPSEEATATVVSASTDATLSALTLSNIDFGTFDPETLEYTAQVYHGITQTHATVTRNHPKATYLVKLGGVTETDGEISLSAGSNVITVEVTAEDGQTMRTYSVTVTRPVSNNAHLIDLTLSGISLEHGSTFYPPGFSALVFNYTPSVAHGLTQTTVTPRVHQSFATYVIKLDGVTDADGVIALSVGSNVITIEVTAEDGQATKTYTITVTRAAAPLTDATLKRLALSGIDIGGGVGQGADAQIQTSFKASVYHSVSQTTVTPTVNHSGASYVIKLGDVEDADGTITLAVGSNVITVEVTAEDDSTTKTYTVTVNRATASASTTGQLSTDDPPVNFRTITIAHDHGIYSFNFPRNRGIFGWVIQRYEHDGSSFVSSGSDMRSEHTGTKDLGGEGFKLGDSNVEPSVLYKWVLMLTDSQGSTVIETSLTVRAPALSSDASLSALTLSSVDFGTFDSTTTSYTVQVANSVSRTTVAPTVNHSGASYVIKRGGVTDADGVIALSVGSNVITVEVTAEDGSTTRTYTVTVTRAASPSTDATLSALTLSGVDFGTFASGTTSYTAQVANSVSQTRVSPTVNHFGASYVIKLGGVEDSDGTVSLASGSNVITIEVTGEDEETTQTYTVTVTRAEPPSTDTSLSGLTLSGIDFGTFASGTTSYTAQVTNSVSQTTVTPTVNDSEATYVIKLGGVTDADGVIGLSVGSNVITIEVTAEDKETTQTYTVTVTRAEPPSTDASLSGLTLSGIDFGTFASGTTSYSVRVAYSVSETTVTPTVNDSGASYVIKLGGVEDADGKISLAVGSNVITVEVTAEDDSTTEKYTVTVTRTAPSTDATLSGLTLSGIDFGTFASGTISYNAQVPNSVSQTTVTPTVNDSGASHVIKLGGVEDADGKISLVVGSNVITIEVTAEDDSTTRTYTVTVTRAAPPSTDSTLSALTLSSVDFGTFDSTTTSYTAQVANSVVQTTVTPSVNDSGASYVVKLGGVTDADGVIALSVGSNVITIEVTAEDDSTTRTYTVTVTRAEPPSTDANLSALTLSGVDFGTFASSTTSYSAQAANSVSQTTVTPTVNDPGASHVIKLGGVTDADGVVVLRVGSNVITVEVTAEDDSTTRTYTVTVTRTEPLTPELSSDATLTALTLSGMDFGTFDSTTISYTGQVANGVTQTTVTLTVNDPGARYVIKLGGVTDADGTVSLAVGSNVITIEVTAEDGETTRKYTVTVTRAAPPSTDATLSALTLSGIDFGTFASGTTSYTAQVANSVTQTTVTAAVNQSGASYVIKLGGVTDADRVVVLAVGNNVITVEVTAEDDSTTRTYTVTVTRAEPASTDATLGALALSGVAFGTFDSTTTSYTAQVANSVTETTVTPTVNNPEASYVIKLGGTVDSDGVIPLSVGGNVITIEVTSENGDASRVYTVEVTRSEPAAPGTSEQSLEDRYDTNNNGTIEKNEVFEAINDYLFGEGDGAISKAEVIELIDLYLFG